ncbi:MAG: hypothetical protein JWM71_1839 [Solirubrobacteraceae bacterium]|nr:hypothetical protein [Solirubrobacteraceae bacterium]
MAPDRELGDDAPVDEHALDGLDVLDRLAEAVSIIGPDGAFLHSNAAATAIFAEISARKGIDASGTPLLTSELPAERTRETGEEYSDVEIGFPGTDGRGRWLRISTRRLSEAGPPYSVVVTYADVTEARSTGDELDRQRSRYQAVVDALHEGVVVQDADGRVIAANGRAQELLNSTADQLMGLVAADGRWRPIRRDGTPWAPEDHPASRVRATGLPQVDELMGMHFDNGELRWLRVNAMPVRRADGTLEGVVATFADETDALRDREALERATLMFSTAFADAPIGMALVDLDGSFMQVNRSVCALTGYSEEELLARTFQEITHPDDLDADLGQIQKLLAGEIDSYSMQKRYFTAGGRLIWVNLYVSLVRAPDGTPEHFISQIEDISERKRMEDELQRLADHDPLTDLWNRRRFEEELQRQLGRCKRYGETAALLLLDLDDFKQVNDTLGHKAGDDLLCAVADAMRVRLRRTDSLARLGGDEFAVLLAHVAPDQARVLAEDLAQSIRAHPVTVRGREITATASIGVALLDRDMVSAEAALMGADIAMYESKAAGRGRTSVQTSEPSSPAGPGVLADRRTGPIRVLLCDASGPYRRLIEIMVDQHTDLELVGSATDQTAAIEAAGRLSPDVVLLDALLPPHGRPAMGAIRAAAPGATVLILSSLDNASDPLRDAADGFVLKTLPLEEIARAIRDAAGPVAADAEPTYGRGAGADSAIATIRKVYAAFARRDVEAALEHTSVDFELMPSGTAALIGREQPYRGHAGVRQYFADAEALWQDIQIDAHDFRATGGGVIVFGQVEGTAAGERIRRQVVWVWQVVDGKATSMRVTDVGGVTPAN